MIAIPLSVRDIPPDHPVRPLRNATGPSVCTCGTCGLSWDDSIATSMTPAPAARCPFEYFHKEDEPPKLSAKAKRENASRKRRAREVLAEYGAATGNGDEEHETNLSDLLADCMHLMGPEAVKDCLRRGAMHYEAEARGEY